MVNGWGVNLGPHVPCMHAASGQGLCVAVNHVRVQALEGMYNNDIIFLHWYELLLAVSLSQLLI